jgi:peptide/nickel transport system substrate-binding protein
MEERDYLTGPTNSGFGQVIADFSGGRLSRRQFLERSALLGLSASSAFALLGAVGRNEVAQAGVFASTPRKGGTLVFAMEAEPTVLDPHRFTSWATWRHIHTMFESLVERDLTKASGQVPYAPLKPALATSWSVSSDGLTYTFDLRKGVKFHDGTDFNADAVKFNIERCWDKSKPHYDATSAAVNAFTWQSLKGIDVVNPFRVRLHLKEPFGEFVGMLAEAGIGSTGILSPAALQKYGQDGFADHPVGTGPFKFVERVRGEKTVVARSDNYWGKPAYLDQVIIRPIQDAAARVLALQSGDVDMVSVVLPDSIKQLQSKGFVISEGSIANVWHLNFNFRQPVVHDLKVRQAVIMAINREGMARDLLLDTAKPAHGLLNPANPAYEQGFQDYPYDPEHAKSLMKQAGYAKGFRTKVLTSNTGSGLITPVPMNEWIQRDLQKIGINYQLDVYEWNTHTQLWAKGGKPGQGFLQQAWGMPTPFLLEIMTRSSFSPPGGCCNVGSFRDKVNDALLAKAHAEVDDNRRIARYRDVNRYLTKRASHVPVVNDLAPLAMKPTVKGFVHAPLEWYSFATIWKES